jgi:hypothetical protein
MRRMQSPFIIGILATSFLAVAGCRRPLPADVSADAKTVNQLRELLTPTSNAGNAAAAPTANPTGFATFSGVIKVDGQPPPMPPVPVSGGDAGYCAPGGRAPLMETVVIGPDGGFANVLVYVDMPIPQTWEHPDDVAKRDALLVGAAAFDQKGCMFLSHVFAMRATQTAEVKNSDTVSHNTNIKGTGKAKSTNEIIPPGKSINYAPTGPSRGPFSVNCNIHPWMDAYVSVHDNPYFAVTDKEGRFEIKNVPAGVDLTFKIWQERVKTNWTGVKVNGADAKWSKNKFVLNLKPDSSENWEVVVDASILQ